MEKRKQYEILGVIVLSALLLRLLYFNTHIMFPGTNLILEAMHILAGVYDINIIWHQMGTRYVFLLLETLTIYLLGVNEWTIYLPIFLASLKE